jgi:hypothetical protein
MSNEPDQQINCPVNQTNKSIVQWTRPTNQLPNEPDQQINWPMNQTNKSIVQWTGPTNQLSNEPDQQINCPMNQTNKSIVQWTRPTNQMSNEPNQQIKCPMNQTNKCSVSRRNVLFLSWNSHFQGIPSDAEISVCNYTNNNNLCKSSSSTGTTAHCGLWPVEQDPSIFSYQSPTLSIIIKSIQLFTFVDFRNNKFFYCVGLLAQRQTPNLEDQGIPFCLGHHPWPVRHGRPYQ